MICIPNIFPVRRDVVSHLFHHPEKVIAVGTTSVRTLESLYWMGVKRILGDADFNSLGQWEVYSLPSFYSVKESMGSFAVMV